MKLTVPLGTGLPWYMTVPRTGTVRGRLLQPGSRRASAARPSAGKTRRILKAGDLRESVGSIGRADGFAAVAGGQLLQEDQGRVAGQETPAAIAEEDVHAAAPRVGAREG